MFDARFTAGRLTFMGEVLVGSMAFVLWFNQLTSKPPLLRSLGLVLVVGMLTYVREKGYLGLEEREETYAIVTTVMFSLLGFVLAIMLPG